MLTGLDNTHHHLLCDNLHVEQGGVVGDVLEVLGVEPPSGLSVTHPDNKGSVQCSENKLLQGVLPENGWIQNMFLL